MSLFGSIQMAGNSLRATDIALQVVGQNISNANTPGYLREEAVLQPAATQQLGNLILGTGVEVEGVVQKVDKFLQERLRSAVSDSSNTDTVQQNYSQLETAINALSNSSDLSTSMNNFFNSISEILNQPADITVRSQAVSNGQTLAQNITQMSQQVEGLRSNANDQIRNMAGEINNLTLQISQLNVKIASLQGGTNAKSDAVGLTDQREEALESLAKLINIQSVEQPNGSVTVYSGNSYLVSGDTSRPVDVVSVSDNGFSAAEIHIADNDEEINPTSGELKGLIDSRDKVLGGFQDQLDDFAQTLTFEFNKLYSSGQGLNGYSTLTSTNGVGDASKALNDAGLQFTPQNGSFQVLVRDKNTGLTNTTTIQIDLNGLGHETTLEDLNDALNNVNGIQSQILTGGKLKIDSTSTDNEIAFANDTSGVLAALGLNVFFTGTSANNMGVSGAVTDDPGKFAASQGGIGADTDNAEIMANFVDQPIDSHNGESIGAIYDRMIADVAQGSAAAQANANGSQAFESSLRSQQTAISGVSLDDEAVNMITYQRSFQASAKYIATISDLLNTLVQL
ncbi:MAG: flagellar hook-associated protein FlgK [Thermoguttaceae bacterium]|jgi:flagellar hook-associated protein 1 FlgK